jgi:PleD family two-component response regulator
MLDIGHFKSVNDDHGHQGGDDLLREISAATVARSDPMMSRQGLSGPPSGACAC